VSLPPEQDNMAGRKSRGKKKKKTEPTETVEPKEATHIDNTANNNTNNGGIQILAPTKFDSFIAASE
jgi:hypothetical protein